MWFAALPNGFIDFGKNMSGAWNAWPALLSWIIAENSFIKEG
jgi:hypothetical protein